MFKRASFRPAFISVVLLALVFVLVIPVGAAVQLPSKMPKAQGPCIVTTLGQTPGALMVKMLCDQIKVKCDEDVLFTADQFQAALKKKDTAYKTLFITMGTSLKGMGAAGVDLDQEIKRVTALVTAARKAGALIVGTQIEGPSRRTDEYDEKSNKTVCNLADFLIIRKDVDSDGFFAKVAKDRNIPIAYVGSAMETSQVLKPLFGVK